MQDIHQSRSFHSKHQLNTSSTVIHLEAI